MNEESAPVGVIIPAWNAATTIDQALASVAGQDLQPAQVTVVDDASDDTTAEAAALWRDHLNIEVLRLDRNVGAAEATNLGVARLHTPLLAILDADDIWLPDHLATLAPMVAPGIAALADALGWVPGARLGLRSWADAHPWPRDLLVAEANANWVLNSFVMQRDDFVAVGGNGAHRRCHDHDLWLRWLDSGRTMRRASTPTLLYRQHGTSVSKGAAAIKDEADILATFAERGGRHQVVRAAQRSAGRALRRSRLFDAYDEARNGRTVRSRALAVRSLGPPLALAARGAAVVILPRHATRLHDRLQSDPKRLTWG